MSSAERFKADYIQLAPNSPTELDDARLTVAEYAIAKDLPRDETADLINSLGLDPETYDKTVEAWHALQGRAGAR